MATGEAGFSPAIFTAVVPAHRTVRADEDTAVVTVGSFLGGRVNGRGRHLEGDRLKESGQGGMFFAGGS